MSSLVINFFLNLFYLLTDCLSLQVMLGSCASYFLLLISFFLHGVMGEKNIHSYFCILTVLISWIAITIHKHSCTGYSQVIEREENEFSQVTECMCCSHCLKYRMTSLEVTESITISQYSQLSARSFTAAKRNTSEEACSGCTSL